jgi:hypothetical protein
MPADPVVSRAVRSLPLAIRFRRFRNMSASFSALALLIGAGVAANHFISSAAPPAELEIVERLGDRTTRVDRVILRRDGWDRASPLAVALGRPGIDSLPRTADGNAFVPGRDAWAEEVQSGDSGGVDVAIIYRDGHRRRLTKSPADEIPGGWSPDGAQLAIRTSAFTGSKYKTLGIFDLATGAVRSVGDTDDVLSGPAWSPDGTSIAYSAGTRDSAPDDICIISIASSRKTCRLSPFPRALIVGWIDGQRLLVLEQFTGTVRQLDVARWEFQSTGIENVSRVALSPDGKWLDYTQRRSTGTELYVAPSEDLPLARRVATTAANEADAMVSWRGVFSPREYLDSIHIESPLDTIPVGVPFQLAISGTSNVGRPMRVNAADWTSLNPSLAKIDSNGVLTPIRTGIATIELSAGGWRRARRSFVIRADTGRPVLSEPWTTPFADRWIRFGHPFPRIVSDSLLGASFLNNGDGKYFSGAYLSHTLDGRRGMAIDATVRLPITEPIGQYIEFLLDGIRGIDSVNHNWNHVTGYPPSEFLPMACGFSYPSHEGLSGALAVGHFGVLTRPRGQALPDLARGLPVHVRIQLLPDGRCGIAMDGQRPSISDTRTPGTDSLTVLIAGNSVNTRLLVGPLTIRSGVPAGVDWTQARHIP